MTTLTPNLEIIQIDANQSLKHVTINEALLRLDALVQASVISAAETVPPATPADGDRYLVAAGATGDWAGQGGTLALRQASAWVFLAPRPGWRVWDRAADAGLVHDGTAWVRYMAGFGAGDAGKVLRVNAAEDGVEWDDDASGIAIESVVASTYTTVDADHTGGKIKKLSDGTGVAVTVAAGLTNPEPCTFIQAGAGQVTFAADVGVTLNSLSGNLRISGQYGSATLIPEGSDVYTLIGSLVA